MINIDKLILNKTKEVSQILNDGTLFIDDKVNKSTKAKEELAVYKLIKAKFIEFRTSENGVKKLVEIDGVKDIADTDKISILNKMIKERQQSVAAYKAGNRPELAEKEEKEISIISEFLPKAATVDDILAEIKNYMAENGFVDTMPKPNMGLCIKYVKGKLTNVDGKILSDEVKKLIT